MCIISFAINSTSARKTTYSKILAGTFCVSTRVPTEAPRECISGTCKEYNTSRFVNAIVIVDCVKSNLPYVTKH